MPVATSTTIVDATIVTAADDRPANDSAINAPTSGAAIDAPTSDTAIDATTGNAAAIDAAMPRHTATMETATTTTTAAYGLRNGLSRRPTMRN